MTKSIKFKPTTDMPQCACPGCAKPAVVRQEVWSDKGKGETATTVYWCEKHKPSSPKPLSPEFVALMKVPGESRVLISALDDAAQQVGYNDGSENPADEADSHITCLQNLCDHIVGLHAKANEKKPAFDIEVIRSYIRNLGLSKKKAKEQAKCPLDHMVDLGWIATALIASTGDEVAIQYMKTLLLDLVEYLKSKEE